MQLLSLAVGSLVVAQLGIRPVYWAGGALLFVAGALGLWLLGGYTIRRKPEPIDSGIPS
jgi:hypothetical protein